MANNGERGAVDDGNAVVITGVETAGIGDKDIVSANRDAFRLIANLNVSVHLLRRKVDTIKGAQPVFSAIIGSCIRSYVSEGAIKSNFARLGISKLVTCFSFLAWITSTRLDWFTVIQAVL